MSDAKESRLEKLKQRKARLEAQITRAEQTERQAERRRDTRRKILIGAAVLAELDSRPDWQAVLTGILDRRLTQGRDRALLADLLPPPVQPGDGAD